MNERAKYAEIYGQAKRVTPEDRAAFRQIWNKVWGDELAYELAPTNFITWHELHRVADRARRSAPAHVSSTSVAEAVALACGSHRRRAPLFSESTSRQKHARPRDVERQRTMLTWRPSIASRT